jgi:hypothetical protein
MENIKNIKIELPNGEYEEITIITNADGSETSMQKTDYDKQQAEQSTPIVIDEAKTK